MPGTTNFNIPLYGPTDTAALDTLLNGQSNALDTALTSSITSFIGTDAQRTALSGARLREGATWRTTDTDRDWYYDGSNWLSADNGMYLISPSSVTGGSVSNGRIAITNGQSSITVNGAFSSRFRNYKVIFDATFSTASSVSFAFTAAGTPSATGYYTQYHYASGTTAAAASVANVTSFTLQTYSGSSASHELLLQRPAMATDSYYSSISNVHTIGMWSSAGYHSPTTAYDGFRFIMTTGTFTGGNISVYGMA